MSTNKSAHYTHAVETKGKEENFLTKAWKERKERNRQLIYQEER
jgi:hypothetical protein